MTPLDNLQGAKWVRTSIGLTVVRAASGELDVLDLTTFTLAQRVPLPYFMTTIRAVGERHPCP
jgi:hypothetical protein